jgi:hypothetical protein
MLSTTFSVGPQKFHSSVMSERLGRGGSAISRFWALMGHQFGRTSKTALCTYQGLSPRRSWDWGCTNDRCLNCHF